MATTLETIRFIIERSVRDTLDSDWVIDRCNDAQSEFSLNINIPATSTITLTTTGLQYTLPADLKIINRLWLQSDYDNGIDKEFKWPYRIYNGKIIFQQPWIQTDTLNVDYYRNMKYFSVITDTIDIADRFTPLYTSYGQREYYNIPTVKERLGEAISRKEWEKHNARYNAIATQIVSYYSIQNEPVTVDERW